MIDLNNPDKLSFEKMTDIERWALMGAQQDGREIEYWDDDAWRSRDNPLRRLYPNNIYRLKPKPETVTVYGHFAPNLSEWIFDQEHFEDTHSITFQLDKHGKPDCSVPVKMEEL